MKKGVGIDLDNDGKPDIFFDLKTLILVVGGIISVTMTYATLTRMIEINKVQIEVAKKLPPKESLDIINQKILFLEQHIKTESERLDKLEDKIYKR
tara:strand:+ start:267 stop:554 length:288 start_codon:yes stop_codon:yes gene_type:complete